MYKIGPFIESGRVNRSWNPYAPRSTDDFCPYRAKSGCYGMSGACPFGACPCRTSSGICGLSGIGDAQTSVPSSKTILWLIGGVVAAGLIVGGLDIVTKKAGL